MTETLELRLVLDGETDTVATVHSYENEDGTISFKLRGYSGVDNLSSEDDLKTTDGIVRIDPARKMVELEAVQAYIFNVFDQAMLNLVVGSEQVRQ